MTTPIGPQAQEAAISELLALIPTNWCDSLLTGPNAVINGPTYDGQDIERLLLAIRKRIEAFVPPARVVSDEDLPRLPNTRFWADSMKLDQPGVLSEFPCEIFATLNYRYTVKYDQPLFTAEQMKAYAQAALSTLQSCAEGKDGSAEIPVELQDAWDAIDDVTFGALNRYAKDVIARYLTPGMKGHSRIVGSRKIDGVHVIIAKPASELMDEQLLVRYDDYLLATSGKHTANVPSLTVDETMSRAWGVPAGTYVLETTK